MYDITENVCYVENLIFRKISLYHSDNSSVSIDSNLNHKYFEHRVETRFISGHALLIQLARTQITFNKGKKVSRDDARWCGFVIRIDIWTSDRTCDRRTFSPCCRNPPVDVSSGCLAICISCHNWCRCNSKSASSTRKSHCTPELAWQGSY